MILKITNYLQASTEATLNLRSRTNTGLKTTAYFKNHVLKNNAEFWLTILSPQNSLRNDFVKLLAILYAIKSLFNISQNIVNML